MNRKSWIGFLSIVVGAACGGSSGGEVVDASPDAPSGVGGAGTAGAGGGRGGGSGGAGGSSGGTDGGGPGCGLAPRVECCFADEQCTGRCYGASCAPQSEGICKTAPPSGQCWDSRDCGGLPCGGASICPCGAQCFVPDSPGRCACISPGSGNCF